MIKVNDFSYLYIEGMMLIDALKEANADIHGPVLVTLNGNFVAKTSYDITALKDGDEILAMRVVSGG